MQTITAETVTFANECLALLGLVVNNLKLVLIYIYKYIKYQDRLYKH